MIPIPILLTMMAAPEALTNAASTAVNVGRKIIKSDSTLVQKPQK